MRLLPPALIILAVALSLVMALQLRAAGVAEAHALLVRADPPVNSQVREPPAVMTLYFSEGVERRVSTVRVVNADKQRVDTGVEFDDSDDALMRVKLTELQPGYYSVIWETLSKVDGHRIAGQYPITVLRPDGSLPPGIDPNQSGVAAQVSGTEAKPERVVTKWALLLAGSVVTGAVAFSWVVSGIQASGAEEVRQAATTNIAAAAAAGLCVLAIAGFADLLLQADSVFGSLTRFPDVIADTRWGERWVVRNALVLPLAIGLASFYRQQPGTRSQLLLAALLCLAAAYLGVQASVSHAAAGRGSFWATTSDFVHLIAASVWVGMLLQLGLLVRWTRRQLPDNRQPRIIASALSRFSLVAVAAVALLLFTGVVNSVIEVESANDLFDSGYGRTLLVKLVLIVPLLLAGALNAYLYRPEAVEEAERLERHPGMTSGWPELGASLSRTVRIEAALAAAVLLAVAVLVQVAPPRSALAAPSDAGKFTETRKADDITITLVIDPNQPGLNTFETYLTGGADVVERVRLIFERQDTEGFQSDLILDASNPPVFYVGRGPFLNEGGKWRLTVELRRSRGNDLLVPFAVRVTAPGTEAGGSPRGGAFQAPRSFSAAAVLLIVVSGLLSAGLVVAGLDRPERPAGLMGDWVDQIVTMEARPRLSLAALLIVGIVVGIIVGTHTHDILPASQARTNNPVPASPQSIEMGRQLFMQNCIQCHGETGRGDGPLAPSLSIRPANLYDHIPFHPDQFFYNIISSGLRGIMPAFGSQLSDEERWHLLNFLRDQFGQGAAAQ